MTVTVIKQMKHIALSPSEFDQAGKVCTEYQASVSPAQNDWIDV